MPEHSVAASNPRLEDFHHCFRCGFGEEYGAKLKIQGNEKICQRCRKAEVEKEFD